MQFKRIARLALCPLLLLCSGGCRRGDDRATAEEKPAGAAPGEIDRLRALPYLGYAEEEEDETVKGVVAHDKRLACPGFTLIGFYGRCSADLIDAGGRVVHSWSRPSDSRWENCELLPNGDLLLAGADRSAPRKPNISEQARLLQRLSWTGQVVWKRKIVAHHDVEITPFGRILTLTSKMRPVPAIHDSVDTCDDRLTLLTLDGEVLEHCSLYEAMSGAGDIFALQEVAPKPWFGGSMVDLFHTNSVEWMHHKRLEEKHPIYAASNILITSRHQDTVAVIKWEEKRVVWAWGQGELSGPHDATVLETGNILIFDNGLGLGRSRVVELDPMAKKVVWEYQAPQPEDFYTRSRGAAQRLANGNTLVTNSGSGQVFEITPKGQVVWEYASPYLNAQGQRCVIWRAKRYSPDFVAAIQDRLADGGRNAESGHHSPE
ncbi:MAG: hypothetical protein GY778_16495 [bacterium]|nr:hypothetical protein [bacterium]